MNELKDIVGNLENIEPFGIEPDFRSLGLEPAEVLGFKNDKELDKALKILTLEISHNQLCLIDF